MSKVSVITGMMLGGMVIGGAVSAQTITAFDLASPVPGNQQYGATVGVEFSVNTPIVVTALGAFDAAGSTGAATPMPESPSASGARALSGEVALRVDAARREERAARLVAPSSCSAQEKTPQRVKPMRKRAHSAPEGSRTRPGHPLKRCAPP